MKVDKLRRQTRNFTGSQKFKGMSDVRVKPQDCKTVKVE